MKRTCLILLSLFLLVPAFAPADQITYKNIPYSGTITGYDNFVLKFRAGTGAMLERNLSDVQKIESSRNRALTQAEQAAAAGKYDAASKLYGQAARAARYRWEKALIRDRKFLADARAGQADAAVATWLGMMDDSGASPAATSMKSAIAPAPKGSRENRSAIIKLSAKQTQLARDPRKNQAYLRAVLELKMKLQEAQGDTDAAAKTAQAIMDLQQAAAAPARSTSGSPGRAPAPARSGSTGKVAVMEKLLEGGKIDEVIDTVQKNFPDYSRQEKPGMVLLLGRAQQAKARQTRSAELLKQAGLNFVYIYAEFGQSPEAIEALYRAAMVSKALGDLNGAGHALTALVNAYGGEDDNEWVAQARDALDGLRSGGNE